MLGSPCGRGFYFDGRRIQDQSRTNDLTSIARFVGVHRSTGTYIS